MNQQPACPDWILAREAEINDRIKPFRIEAYLQYDSDGPDEWRYMLWPPNTTQRGHELVKYLQPAQCHPHAVYLMVCGMQAWGKLQHQAGKADAVNKIAEHFKTIV